MKMFTNLKLYSKKKLVEAKDYGTGIYTFEGVNDFLVLNPMGVNITNSVFAGRFYTDVCEILPRPAFVPAMEYLIVDEFEIIKTNDAGFFHICNNVLIAIVDNCMGISFTKTIDGVTYTFSYSSVAQIFVGNEIVYERYMKEDKPTINKLDGKIIKI